MPSVQGKNTTSEGEITPQELSRIQTSIRGLEQAPSSRQQLGAFANWKQIQEQLGQPFNNERIALSKLKLMRRDPMIGFGLHFTKTPMVRAPWYIHCADPQVAAFMDGALRLVMPSLIIQCLQKFDFGFQAIAKRFAFEVPNSTYVDPNTGNEVEAWPTSSAGEPPVVLKPFVALPPEGCTPLFDDTSGEFNGISYKPPKGGGAPSGTGARKKGAGGSEGEVEIDLYHSLWVTNEKDSVFGNIFGYPRLGYAYPYWWSYWFRWAVSDRAFERKGDPQTLVRYPEGSIDLGNGEVISNAEYALLMADRLRSGAGLALPSTPYLSLDDKPSTVKEWDIEFVTDGLNFDPFDKSFDYLDVQKLRAIFVPEQALIEGGGGTSSRNVAKEMYQGLVEAQSIEMGQIVEVVNRFIIPHLLIVNFPEKQVQGLKAEMKTRGFAAQDMEMLLQIVQLIGQSDPELLGVDIREALNQINMPLVSQQEYERRLAEKAAAAVAAGPGEVPPTSSSAGVVPTPGRAPATEANQPGSANGSSALGFTYIPAIDRIELGDASAEYIANLPGSMHYTDEAVRAMSRQLWSAMHDFYGHQYQAFAEFLDSYGGDLHLADEDQEAFEMAPSDFIRDMARRIVGDWRPDLSVLDNLVRRLEQILDAIMRRVSSLTRKEGLLEKEVSDEDRDAWVKNRVAEMVSKTIRTTRQELEDFTANHIDDGSLDPDTLAAKVRSHFTDFPEWKADRYARTETRDAYNAGVLHTARANGLTVVQAVDGLLGKTDVDCEERDGQFFTVDQALRETEHPNGTLGWRLMKEPVTLSRTDEIPVEGAIAHFDEDTNTIFLARDISPEAEQKFLVAVGERIGV